MGVHFRFVHQNFFIPLNFFFYQWYLVHESNVNKIFLLVLEAMQCNMLFTKKNQIEIWVKWADLKYLSPTSHASYPLSRSYCFTLYILACAWAKWHAHKCRRINCDKKCSAMCSILVGPTLLCSQSFDRSAFSALSVGRAHEKGISNCHLRILV